MNKFSTETGIELIAADDKLFVVIDKSRPSLGECLVAITIYETDALKIAAKNPDYAVFVQREDGASQAWEVEQSCPKCGKVAFVSPTYAEYIHKYNCPECS